MTATIKQLRESLAGNVCPACSRFKQARRTVCFACWGRLPHAMGRSLYQRIGHGYEQAFASAMTALGVATPHLPAVRGRTESE